MTAQLKSFAIESKLGTSPTNMVVTNTSQTAFLGNITLTNTATTDIEIYIWRLRSGTTPTTGVNGNWIERLTLAAGKTIVLGKIITHVLGPSMVIQGQAGTANAVNFDASGTIET